MYGTVARLRFDPANGDSLVTNLMDHPREETDGFISGEVLLGDTPGEAWLVVKFRDKASYEANANAPEQHERYTAFRAFLSEDPEWHDGEWAGS
jgi:hypothetical protein